MLSRLAADANVAQFVSFGPGRRPAPAALVPARPPARPPVRAAPRRRSGPPRAGPAAGSVNVRSFQAGAPKGGPFSYGLTRRDDVMAVLRARAGDGLHTIANETVDVDDGGVSGVALGGLVEFAPGDTPRSVERPGTVALGHDHAMRLLRTVYGFTPDLDGRPDERVEFSIHPLVAGVRQTHTIVWERERVDPVRLTPSAHLAQPVQPLPRATRPSACWWPTCTASRPGHHRRRAPGRPVPLRPPHRQRRALDPHLPGRAGPGQVPDPAGLAGPVRPPGRRRTRRGRPSPPCSPRRASRPGGRVPPSPTTTAGCWSRASPGSGEDFMLAREAPAPLPDRVLDDVRRVGDRAAAALGPVRFEWAHDGADAWVVQLHLATAAATGTTIHPGTPSRWRRFDPSLGLDAPPPADRDRRPGRGHRAHRRRRRHLPRRRPAPPGRDPVPPGRPARLSGRLREPVAARAGSAGWWRRAGWRRAG